MKENENLQKDSQESLLSTSKRGRKPKVEKMEVEKNVEEVAVKEEKATQNGTTWIKNVDTKVCEACGAIMRGWAFREPFAYCPKCGAKADKEA